MNNSKSIIFYTANRIYDEMMNKNVECLKKSAVGIPIISVSQKPMPDLGTNIVFENKEQTYLNIYRQLYIGAKASTSDILYACEDDTFYAPSHFELYPFDENTFAYNMNKWSYFVWRPDIFSNRNRKTLNCLIAPRLKLIEALEERFDLLDKLGDKIKMCYWSEFSRNVYERHLGVKEQKGEELESREPIVMVNHEKSINYLKQGTRKRLGDKRAFELPYWGSAKSFGEKYSIL